MTKKLKSIVAGALILVTALWLAAKIIGANPAGPQTFTDVPVDHWAYKDVEQAYQMGAVNGTYNDGVTRTYDPDGLLDMFQWITILTNAYYADEVAALPDDQPYYGSMFWRNDLWFSKNMFVGDNHHLRAGLESYEDEDITFYRSLTESLCMNRPIVRFEMAMLSYNLLKDMGVELPAKETVIAFGQTLPDWQYIPELYQESAATLAYLGVLTGIDNYGTFSGYGVFTRAQAATVFCRLDKVIKGVEIQKPELLPAPNPGTPIAPADLNGDGVITESEVITKMMELENGEFSNGGSYENVTPYYSKAMPDYIGLNCGKIGLMMSDALFGDLPYWEHSDITKIRPGDTIIYPGHMGVVFSHHWINIDYPEMCHYLNMGGSVSGVIGWSAATYNLDYDTVKIRTRYPIGQ